MTTPAPHAYRIVRVADPRSRGACSWYEIEGIAADGSRWHVAVCDSRAEARTMVRNLEAAQAAINRREAVAAARQALADARRAAARVNDRRMAAGRIPPDAVARLRQLSPSLVADRAAIAAAIRTARAELVRNCD